MLHSPLQIKIPRAKQNKYICEMPSCVLYAKLIFVLFCVLLKSDGSASTGNLIENFLAATTEIPLNLGSESPLNDEDEVTVGVDISPRRGILNKVNSSNGTHQKRYRLSQRNAVFGYKNSKISKLTRPVPIRARSAMQRKFVKPPPERTIDERLGDFENTITELSNAVNVDEGCRKVGITVMKVNNRTIRVLCDNRYTSGIVIQQRIDGSIDFYRGWDEYVSGFGNMRKGGEFWLGLDSISALTLAGRFSFYMEARDILGEWIWLFCSTFHIGGAEEKFKLLEASGCYGSAGRALEPLIGKPFSTKDNDNDDKADRNCAEKFKDGWWYSPDRCDLASLNGEYVGDDEQRRGIHWPTHGKGTRSLEFVVMKLIRADKYKRGF